MTPFRYKNLLYLLAALIVTIGVASCSTSRSTSQSTDAQYQAASVSDCFKALTATYSDWQQINVPIKVAIESPTKLSASGRAYMQRDKYIYISMRFLGMEVANAYIDTDSIIVCDKMNHRYVGESIRDLLAGADITLADLQNLLLGRAFIAGDGSISASSSSKVSLKDNGDTWSITPRKKNKTFTYAFTIDSSTNTLSLLDIATGNSAATVNYDNAYATSCGTFMSSANVKAPIGKSRLNATLSFTFKSAKFSDVKVKRPSLSGYTRITAEQLLKALSNM